MKRILCVFCVFVIFAQVGVFAAEPVEGGLALSAKSSILIEQRTGEVLYEENADERLPIASVTKVMTMLLIVEAIDAGVISSDDTVCVSNEASKMGGSQIYLEAGEEMSVHDMLKGIAVASGNDASAAMAEFLMGNVDVFVDAMNRRAGELGMVNTHYMNVHGLDEDGHYSSARDVAIVSRELMSHPIILEYTTIWMDSLRNGEFSLVNTNKLIRFYSGANGLKTGSTSKAGYCLSASANRNDMQLIAVVLGAENSDGRFATATKLLDYGFANYAVAGEEPGETEIAAVYVSKGESREVDVSVDGNFGVLVSKNKQGQIKKEIVIEAGVAAPVEKGQKVGELEYWLDGQRIGSADIVASEAVGKVGVLAMIKTIFVRWLSFS